LLRSRALERQFFGSLGRCHELSSQGLIVIELLRCNAEQLGTSISGADLANQHAIAVAVEAIVCFHGVAIGVEDMLASGECGHHGEQARLWQVEIGEELAYGAKWLAGIEENFGLGF